MSSERRAKPGGSGTPGGAEREHRCPRFAELDRQITAERQRAAKSGSRTRRGNEAKPKHKEPALPAEMVRELKALAKHQRKLYKAQFRADPELKDRAARSYRNMLLPKPTRPGRPPIESVTKAIKLLRKYERQYPEMTREQIWKMIYPKTIPGYRKMDKEERKAQQFILRERVKGRKNQRKRRQERT